MTVCRLKIAEVDYAYQDAGNGSSLLLLHGFTGCKENWDWLIMQFEPQRRVIALDLLGHGQSSAPKDHLRYAMERTAADLKTFLDTLNIPEVDLLGYSMGGRLALYFALTYPWMVNSLVLESASPGLEGIDLQKLRRLSDEALADRIEQNGILAFVEEWESLPLFASQARLSDAVRQKLHEQRIHNDPLGLAYSLRGMGSGAQPSLWERLCELHLPVLLIVGALDEKFTAINLRMKNSISGARLEIVPDAGHSVHLEQPLAYERLLRDFLKDLDFPQGSI